MWLLLTLTGLSIIVFLIGVTWILVSRGKTHRRSGQQVGKEIMTDIMTDDDDGPVLYSTFKGILESPFHPSTLPIFQIIPMHE